MLEKLQEMFAKRNTKTFLTKEEIAEMLKISPEAYEEFEKAYRNNVLISGVSDNFFEVNAKQAAESKAGVSTDNNEFLDDIMSRIIKELNVVTDKYIYDGKTGHYEYGIREMYHPVSKAEILKLPESERPQLTGSMMQVTVDRHSSDTLLLNYKGYLEAKTEKEKETLYHLLRQGLDILDFDEIMYEMIGSNPNSIGHWFPQLVEGLGDNTFFKIPKTTIIKVPAPVLQLTRIGYENLTRTTLDIVDKYCYEAFNLDTESEYFIKTGTYSSKFDFRNAYVHGAKEVRELGEYLLFIHYQANQMASPLTRPCIYGVSTTNEWVVREFIHDKENNPCIYKGLPLHTEYRVFVDFDDDEVLAVAPYWEPKTMLKRFKRNEGNPMGDSMDDVHDYAIYESHKELLMERYEKNKDVVCKALETVIRDIDSHGQWSIDIMQNGDEFYIIDMALAKDSAFVEYIPADRLKQVENWLPSLEGVLKNEKH